MADIGPALHHYIICYRVWVWATSTERIADTHTWFPTSTIMPFKSSADAAIMVAIDLANALHHSPASPMCPVSDDSQHAHLRQLAVIFQQHTQAPPLPTNASPTSAPWHALPAPTVPTTNITSVFPTTVPLPTVVPHIVPDVLLTQVPLPWVTPYNTTTPDSIIAQYKLLDLIHNGYVLVEIMKGM
jgi:hypothetical protein